MFFLSLSRHEEYQHCSPFPLTDAGKARAIAAAADIRDICGRPDLIISSPLLRALQTAEAHACGLTVTTDDRLHEDADKPSIEIFKQELVNRAAIETPAHIHLVTHQPVIARFTDYHYTCIMPGETLIYKLDDWNALLWEEPKNLLPAGLL